jgi:hypothetical protein
MAYKGDFPCKDCLSMKLDECEGCGYKQDRQEIETEYRKKQVKTATNKQKVLNKIFKEEGLAPL